MTKILSGYIHRAQQKSEFTSLTLVYPAGSIYEPEGKHGVSHLMEHLICKLVDKYEERFLNDCIEFNAETCFNYVEFFFRGLESKLPREFKQQLVSDLLSGFDSITKEELETEKNIVIQEITDCYDDPVDGNILNNFYKYYNLVEPGGFVEDIKNFTYEDAKKMYNDVFMHPLRIVEVGKEWTEFKGIEYCTELPKQVSPKFKATKKEIMPVAKGDKAQVYAYGKKVLKRSDFQYLLIASHMLTFGRSSPMTNELREKRGLTYDISCDFQPIQDHAIFWFFAMTSKDKAKELADTLEYMCKNVRKYLTKERFDTVINFIKTKREIQKCNLWKHPIKYTENENPRIITTLDKIKFEKLVGIVEKYLYNVHVVVC